MERKGYAAHSLMEIGIEHLTMSGYRWLTFEADNLFGDALTIYTKNGGGFFVYIDDANALDEHDTPSEIFAIVDYATKHGFDVIDISTTHQICEDLAVYYQVPVTMMHPYEIGDLADETDENGIVCECVEVKDDLASRAIDKDEEAIDKIVRLMLDEDIPYANATVEKTKYSRSWCRPGHMIVRVSANPVLEEG